MEKILIIKVGHSETLDPEISSVTSYGDVLRTTVLLHLYKDAQITWLVDESAYPILKGNPYLHRILIYNLTSVLQLQAEQFDTVINLEKVPGLCALADTIKAWRRFGFRFDPQTGAADAYDGTHDVLTLCRDREKKRTHSRYWQQRLYEMVGARWDGQEYILGYRPRSREQYDIGFNYMAGNKWPTKMWPRNYWEELERLIAGTYSISWQQGLDNMQDYFEWIHSCRLIITNDSFGLHLALALKKKVLGMFGPTNFREHYLYGRGSTVVPEGVACEYAPCHNTRCVQPRSCLCRISPETIWRSINDMLDVRERNAADDAVVHSAGI